MSSYWHHFEENNVYCSRYYNDSIVWKKTAFFSDVCIRYQSIDFFSFCYDEYKQTSMNSQTSIYQCYAFHQLKAEVWFQNVRWIMDLFLGLKRYLQRRERRYKKFVIFNIDNVSSSVFAIYSEFRTGVLKINVIA